MLVGGAVGLVNGILVGYLRLRAFLTTLVTLIIVTAIVDTLIPNTSSLDAAGFPIRTSGTSSATARTRRSVQLHRGAVVAIAATSS